MSDGPMGRAADLVPSWLDNLAALSWRLIVIAGVAAVAGFVAFTFWTITASIAVAIVVAAVFAPFVLRLREGGRSRTAAAGIVWAIAVLTIGGVLLLLVLAFLPYAAELVSSISAGIESLKEELEQSPLPPWVAELFRDAVADSEDLGGDFIGGIAASVVEAGTILILATFLFFFFLRDGDKAWLWCFQTLPEHKREEITTAGDDALGRVGGYLRGTTVIAAVTAVANYAFMVILGTPLAIALAVLSFVATYIPYFGGIVTTVIILLVTLGALGTGPALVMLVLLSARTFLVSYFVRPAVYERTVSLHPALVLIVLPLGYQVAGLVGLFAAVPITAVILTVAQAVIDLIQPDPPPELPDLVPAWLDRAAQWSWRALLAVALIAVGIIVLTAVPLVVVPVILALIFAATLQPLVDRLIAGGRARGRAAAIAVSGSTFAIIGVLALTVVSLVDEAAELGATVIEGIGSANETADGQLGLAEDAVTVGVDAMVGTILSIFDDLAAVGAIVLLAVLITFYFLRDGAGIWQRLMAHTRDSAVDELTESFSDAYSVMGGYMAGTAVISFVGAFSQFVIMVILDLPLALPVFVLSFFGGFIPYIGSLITTGLAFLIAVAVGEPIDIVIMAIWTVAFNLVQGNIVAPVVYGRTTNIHPAVVLVGIPAASTVAGILGMFLVVPVLGVVAATWRTVLRVMGSEESYDRVRGLDDSGTDDDAEDTDADSPPAEVTPEPA